MHIYWLTLFLTGILIGHGPMAASRSLTGVGSAGIEENKGQARYSDGEPASEVRYSLIGAGTSIFLMHDRIAYQFHRVLDLPKELGPKMEDDLVNSHQMVETFRMDMVLEGAYFDASMSHDGKSKDHIHYYGHGAFSVHRYQQVTYHDVYPGIDWRIRITPTGMKYDFIVHPGGDPKKIRLRSMHHEELYLDHNGDLIHGNRLGRFIERKPISFQGSDSIPSAFLLEGDLLTFEISHYDTTQTLIIDPDRVWSTYYGTAGGDNGWSCTTDSEGNVYMAGEGSGGSVLGQGGHQVSAWGTSAFLVKFNSSGERLWGTYYGNNLSYGRSCAVDPDGNIYLTGYTRDSTGIAHNGHQNEKVGILDTDAFLVKFDPSGIRLWATYYGGAGTDRGLSVKAGNGQVYLAGSTTSPTHISSGGHQMAQNGISSIFLAKFTADGERLWATYYGGEISTLDASCSLDPVGNVYLAGSTNSFTGIATEGYQVSLAGAYDGFLVKFNDQGLRQWATYFGGADKERCLASCTDTDGNIYIGGSTASQEGIAFEGHQLAFGGASPSPDFPGDGFLTKFDPAGELIWSTYYGGTVDDHVRGLATDQQNNIYMAGYTGSSTGIAFNGYQNDHPSPNNPVPYVAKFAENGEREWGSYYSGSGSGWASACSVEPEGHIYICGSTYAEEGFAYAGHQNDLAGLVDAFLLKLSTSLGNAVNDIGDRHGLSIHPNPVSEGIPLRVKLPFKAVNHRIFLLDVSGRCVLEMAATSSMDVVIPTDGLAAGSYLISIPLEKGALRGRFMVE